MKDVKHYQKWISELVQQIYWYTGLLYFKDYQCNLTSYEKMEQLFLQLLDEIHDWEIRTSKKINNDLQTNINALFERIKEKVVENEN